MKHVFDLGPRLVQGDAGHGARSALSKSEHDASQRLKAEIRFLLHFIGELETKKAGAVRGHGGSTAFASKGVKTSQTISSQYGTYPVWIVEYGNSAVLSPISLFHPNKT